MNWVDILICLVLAVSMTAGVLRGFTREIFSLSVWIIAFWLAWRFGPQASASLQSWIVNAGLRLYAGYVLVFLAVLLAGSIIASVLVKLVRASALAGPDRTLGAALGLMRGLLLIVAGVMLAGVNGDRTSTWWQESVIVPRLAPLADSLRSVMPASWLRPISAHKAPPSTVSRLDG